MIFRRLDELLPSTTGNVVGESMGMTSLASWNRGAAAASPSVDGIPTLLVIDDRVLDRKA
jgi:hypothetical protein